MGNASTCLSHVDDTSSNILAMNLAYHEERTPCCKLNSQIHQGKGGISLQRNHTKAGIYYNKHLIPPMKRKIRLILIGEKNGISLHFLESPDFFFMSLQIFLYQRLAGLQRREKIGQAVKNSRAGREMGIACKHHFKYLSPPSSLPTSRKPFLPSQCQNVWHIRASHACQI